MNHYSDISQYYDLLMDAGYYDHEAVAGMVLSIIGQRRKKMLELGIGTGRLAREIVKIDSSCDPHSAR